MTRKHFEAIARALREVEPDIARTEWNVWMACVEATASAIAANTVRFDRQRFVSSCYNLDRKAA